MFNNRRPSNSRDRNTRSGPGGGARNSRNPSGQQRNPRSPRGPRGPRSPLRNHQPAIEVSVNYKNIGSLHKYLNDRGKIVSRRYSGVSAKSQRRITEAIKRARFLALLPTGGIVK